MVGAIVGTAGTVVLMVTGSVVAGAGNAEVVGRVDAARRIGDEVVDHRLDHRDQQLLALRFVDDARRAEREQTEHEAVAVPFPGAVARGAHCGAAATQLAADHRDVGDDDRAAGDRQQRVGEGGAVVDRVRVEPDAQRRRRVARREERVVVEATARDPADAVPDGGVVVHGDPVKVGHVDHELLLAGQGGHLVGAQQRTRHVERAVAPWRRDVAEQEHEQVELGQPHLRVVHRWAALAGDVGGRGVDTGAGARRHGGEQRGDGDGAPQVHRYAVLADPSPGHGTRISRPG